MAADAGGEWVSVVKAQDLEPGSMKGVEAADKQLAIYNLDGTFFATDNECTHAYAFLTDGQMDGDVIECPLHGGAFEIKTGKGLGPPIFCDLKTYQTRVDGEDVQVLIED
ncbi:MAG: non-heme iron oxygenase ferredoxin subunit [Hyphomicrobiaceae bacterium]